MPVIQGFVGQRSFVVRKPDPREPVSAHVVSAEDPENTDSVSHAIEGAQEGLSEMTDSSQAFLLTLISRRSTKRSGLRYLRRGIDDEGNCANTVETEQILSAPHWDHGQPIRSFVQIRASIPLFFSQSPYSFKPLPTLHQPQSANDSAFKRHFADLQTKHGDVQISLLVDKRGNEVAIGNAYEDTYKRLSESAQIDGVKFDWFDFHAECRGMKFENVERLVQKLKGELDTYGETVVLNGDIKDSQKGIVRANCMDCLDRTNVVESALGRYVLQKGLSAEGFAIDLLADQSTTWFNTLWADNGDAISRQYAGTAALKGDFTRTRKRNMQGAMFDFSLTLTRYYNNMVNDYFSQAVIDVLLGNLSWKTFGDFEGNMMSADPGISITKVREHAIETCRKLVIQDESEDIIHGWTMLAPATENTLRTLPFQEVVVLLTDAALYCCKFDWTTEKVASFEKVDLRSISKIRHGTYITSTLTERQMDETTNAGLVVVYKPGKESIIRTNTRSLQNYVASDGGRDDRIDGGTGILSWLAPRSPPSSRALAVKVIPAASAGDEMETRASSQPTTTAEAMCREIERAIAGGTNDDAQGVKDLVEKGDIISLAEAKKRTGYLEQIGHSIKKLVWT
jgi:SacI homology domain/Inositol phosphatase